MWSMVQIIHKLKCRENVKLVTRNSENNVEGSINSGKPTESSANTTKTIPNTTGYMTSKVQLSLFYVTHLALL